MYEEDHSALNWRLLAFGLFIPGGIEMVLLALAIVTSPLWGIAMVALPFFAPVLVSVGLLYRNWPTGIRIDESGISIGAIRSSRARTRKPTVNHQAWGLFTCTWSAIADARVVTDPGELRRLKKSPRYYTLTNRWGSKLDMTHCNVGVLTSPFMRAALVVEIIPSGVTATTIRPARFFNNFKNGYFSRLVPPTVSPAWVAPTRNPEAVREALARFASAHGQEQFLGK